MSILLFRWKLNLLTFDLNVTVAKRLDDDLDEYFKKSEAAAAAAPAEGG